MHPILNLIHNIATIIGYIVLGYFLLWFLYYLKHWKCVRCSFNGHKTEYEIKGDGRAAIGLEPWYECRCKQAISRINGDRGGWKTHLWSSHP